jgi:hypothetical protein
MIATIATVFAQHHQPTPHGDRPAAAGDADHAHFSVAVSGAFRDMMRKKNHAATVGLDAVVSSRATDAVGALSDLRGEITIADGKPLVTYGAACSDCPPPHAEKATLLISARVQDWHAAISLPRDLSGHDIDRFIIAQAKAAGLDTAKPFPVRLTGTLTNVAMHVIRAPNPDFGGHGSGQPMALQEDIKAATIEGLVVGFYAPEPMLGIITHPGEPFHYHWIDPGRTKTAHLDSFGMRAGATLLLPRR